jgi:hypothetical protein
VETIESVDKLSNGLAFKFTKNELDHTPNNFCFPRGVSIAANLHEKELKELIEYKFGLPSDYNNGPEMGQCAKFLNNHKCFNLIDHPHTLLTNFIADFNRGTYVVLASVPYHTGHCFTIIDGIIYDAKFNCILPDSPTSVFSQNQLFLYAWQIAGQADSLATEIKKFSRVRLYLRRIWKWVTNR